MLHHKWCKLTEYDTTFKTESRGIIQ